MKTNTKSEIPLHSTELFKSNIFGNQVHYNKNTKDSWKNNGHYFLQQYVIAQDSYSKTKSTYFSLKCFLILAHIMNQLPIKCNSIISY
jgi:hypothetical protein